MLRSVAARCVLFVAAAWGASAPAATSSAQALIEGVWRTQLASEITIAPCAEGYCGHISKVVVPEHILRTHDRAAIEQMRAEDFFDYNNKDPNLRGRPILGLRILTLRPAERPHVYQGEIYNPEDGNTYSGFMEVLGPDMVRLNGCVMFNLLCRGEDWSRVTTQ